MNTNSAHLLPESEQIIVDEERPWPGLASFREQDEHFFKGREPDIKQLHDLVGRERLTVLFGVSGLGKSSLLQAGLFPRLRQDKILPVPIRLDFGETSASFREQVFAAIARQVQEKIIEAPLHNENETLWEYFHHKDTEFWDARNRLMIPLLCFDQFEEIFTLGLKDLKRDSDLRKFITEELADLVKGHCPGSVKARLDANPDESKNFNFSHHPYKLIFSLREDYLADLEELRESMPSVIHNRMRLCSINGERALEVADQTQGRLMERSVAETIVRLVAGEPNEAQRELSALCVEPALLSLVCRELNERRIANQAIQIDARIAASDREQILENFYERSLDDQSPELRRFIEDKLITVSGFRDSEAYDNAVGMPGITAQALAQLVQRRVLRLEERNGNKRIELIHDVLTGVVRKSRDQRQVLEKQRQAEQEKREAEQKEQAARKALRIERRFWTLGVALVILALLMGLGLWGYSETQHALAEANFREAQQHYHNNNNMPDALAHLAYSVQTDPKWVPSRSLLVNLLQQRSWFLPVAIFDHKATVHDASFSRDGTRVVTVSNDGTARLWNARTGEGLGEPMTHAAAVRSAQFSPDGTRVATVSYDGTLRLWNARTGQSIESLLQAREKGATSVAFSPDGTRLASGSRDGLHLWNGQTGQRMDTPLKPLEGHVQGVSSVAFSPDGTCIVTSSWDKTARLWNAQTGKALGEPMTHAAAVRSAQFSPDGTRVVTASNDGTARLWSAQTGKPLPKAKIMEHKDRVLSARFSPDGTRVVTASADSTARLWNAQTGASLPNAEPMTHQDAVLSARFSLDGMRVVTASADSSARLWDARTGKSLGEAITHQGRVSSAQFSPDGAYVLTASDDNTARLSDTRIGHLGKTMTHQGRALPAQFSPSGTFVLTASDDNTLQLWDAQTGQPGQPLRGHGAEVTCVAFSPDGGRIVSGSWDKTLRLWDASTGKSDELGSHDSGVLSVAFSPDGGLIVSGSADNKARLWDAETGNLLAKAEVMVHKDRVLSTQFSSDSARVVTASWDKTARLWDARTGKDIGEPMTHEDAVLSARFNRDGTRVVTASADNTARLWDARTGKPLLKAEPMTHQGRVLSAQFNHDGTRVVTASADNTARLWDARTGRKIGEPMTHQGRVLSAQFNHDDTQVVTASEDGTVRLWDARTGKPLGVTMMHRGRVLSVRFSPDGRQVVTASADKTARLWEVPPMISDNQHLLAPLAETIAGNRLNELGVVETLKDQKVQLDRLRRQTANAPLGEPTAESFIHWFLSDPWTRTVSPFSKLTVPEYIQQQIAAGHRDQMKQEFPGHPLLRSPTVSNQPSLDSALLAGERFVCRKQLSQSCSLVFTGFLPPLAYVHGFGFRLPR